MVVVEGGSGGERSDSQQTARNATTRLNHTESPKVVEE